MTEQQASDPVARVVDHVGFAVADYERSKMFYERALAPLGVTLLMEFAGEAAGFGRSGRPSFFVEAHGKPVRGRLHIALRAESRAQVDAFHAAAIEAGGTDNGAPGVRAIYHPDYYGAYVLDPDASGFELCGRLRDGEPGRRWNRDVPVIIVSARGDPVDRVRGFARGCDDYVVKPSF